MIWQGTDSRKLGCGLVMIGSACFTVALPAQTIRGQLLDRATHAPVPAAFITLADERGQEVIRALTDANGRFLLRAPGPGAYLLGSKRIGFRASVPVRVGLNAADTTEYSFELDALPIQLAAVVVEGRPTCGTPVGEGSAVASIWDEAREALAAVLWTSRSQLYHYTIQRYERDLDPVRLDVKAERSATATGRFATPFGAVPPGTLRKQGFVFRESDGGSTFYAPDARVLLSDEFLATHCFAAARDVHDGERIVGLRFSPSPGASLPDILGTLWLSDSSAELRRAEFQYVNLPSELSDDRAGGELRFFRLPNGAWIVDRWRLRVPIASQRVWRLGRREATIDSLRETGGAVLRIAEPDGREIYSQAAVIAVGDVAGVVTDRVTGKGLSKARAEIGELGLTTETDSAGRFTFTGLAGGRYTLAVGRIGYRRERVSLEVRGATTTRLPVEALALMRSAPVVLDTVTVAGQPPPKKLEEFYRRRATGLGRFTTRAEWEQHGNAALITDVLQRMPGVVVRPNPNYMKALEILGGVEIVDNRRWLVETRRGQQVNFLGTRRNKPGQECIPTVFLDGSRLVGVEDQDLNDIISLNDVEAIEVYSGPERVPLEYDTGSSGCGVILLWTR